jgi:hypothetical protein
LFKKIIFFKLKQVIYIYIVLRKEDVMREGNMAKGVQLMLEGMSTDKSIPTDIQNQGARSRCSVFQRLSKGNKLHHRKNKLPVIKVKTKILPQI